MGLLQRANPHQNLIPKILCYTIHSLKCELCLHLDGINEKQMSLLFSTMIVIHLSFNIAPRWHLDFYLLPMVSSSELHTQLVG
jgi:hypothetical protein